MGTQPTGYVSVVGFSLLQGVLTLVEKLEDLPVTPPNEVQTAEAEDGYSADIVVLSAAVVESVLSRTRYVRADGLANTRESVTQYWSRIAPGLGHSTAEINAYGDLAANLNECFAVRDVIVHSHLWEAQIQWDQGGALHFVGTPNLQAGYGDRRFQTVLNGQTRMSHRLSLNLFPSRVWRRDAWTVLKIANEVFDVLEACDRRLCYLTPQSFDYRGEQVHFHDVVGRLPILQP